jgi:SAM-dependent methyltransferase
MHWIHYKEFGFNYYRYWHWAFAENDSFDTIIDCIGSKYWNQAKTEYLFQDQLLQTILRVLRVNGKFYSPFGVYTKINETELLFGQT